MSNTNTPSPLAGRRLLDQPQLELIHQSSLEILQRTGVRVLEREAVELLQEAGCEVSDTSLVKLPRRVIAEALEATPSSIVLSRRDGEPALFLEADRTYFGTGSDLPNTLDLDSGERRVSRLSDVANAARLVDALPNLSFAMSMALAEDVPPALADRYSFRTMMENTTKPVVFTAWNVDGLTDIVAMAEAIAGGAEALRRNPFLLAYLEPSSPLQHSREAMQKVLFMADKGLPFVYAPGPVDGASAPMTPAGGLAMANAEILSGLAIAQLRRPGTPFLFGSGSGPLDMRTAVATYASPAFQLHCWAMADLAHHLYHLPVWGFSGCSDSKIPDVQAGAESALWILQTALSGANLVHDIGYLESGLTGSLEMILVCDEVIGYVRSLLAGIDLSRESLALDVIHEIGPGGDFLASPHTLAHFRESWSPQLFDRQTHEAWSAAGSPSTTQRARASVKDILATHQPEPLEESISQELDAIVTAARGREGIETENDG